MLENVEFYINYITIKNETLEDDVNKEKANHNLGILNIVEMSTTSKIIYKFSEISVVAQWGYFGRKLTL